MSAQAAKLYETLAGRLGRERDLAVSTIGSFLDLLWDADFTLEEIESLESPVVIDSRNRPRRIVVQDVRGRLRYWLTTDRDPIALSTTAETELGFVDTIDGLVRLCREFVGTDLPISSLAATRYVGGAKRSVIVRRWDAASSGRLTVGAIRRLHQPETRHRISVRTYPPGTAFPGSMRAGTCYVLAGTCRYRCGTEEVTLPAGTVAVLPEGSYEFEVVGDESLQEVLVWELPFDEGPEPG